MLKFNTRLLYLKRYICKELDAEMFKISDFLTRRSLFLDIGSNRGLYSYHFSNKFDRVAAFEPVEECCTSIKNLGLRNVEVHQVALSDKIGSSTLYCPVKSGNVDFQRSSLVDSAVSDSAAVERQVQTCTLDDFCFNEVDLIKIDTEGSELRVLNGATKTILDHLPLIFVEMEERHRKNAIRDGITFLKKFGYLCSYYDSRKKTFVNLDIDIVSDDYLLSIGSTVNNFLFHIPEKHCGIN